MVYCTARFCKRPETHLISYHRCRICKKRGHDATEHFLFFRIFKNNRTHPSGLIPKNQYCTVTNCRSRTSHLTREHCCRLCNQKHHEKECGTKCIRFDFKCPFCRSEIDKKFKNHQLHILECGICMEDKKSVKMSCCKEKFICWDCVKEIYIHAQRV